MGLDIPNFLEEYENFIEPINADKIPKVDSKSPRIKLMI